MDRGARELGDLGIRGLENLVTWGLDVRGLEDLATWGLRDLAAWEIGD